MMGISAFFCVAFAVFTLWAVVFEALRLRRREARTFQDSIDTVQRITEALMKLPDLQGRERAVTRLAIVKDIQLDAAFVHYVVAGCYRDHPPRDPEVRERMLDVLREIQELNWELHKCLFVFRFRPRLAGDGQRIFDAASRHCRVWIAYVRLLKVKYPERYGNISIPDFP
jgi:hypothetical protein